MSTKRVKLTWARTCPICGWTYTLTNFMKRRGGDVVKIGGVRVALANTHLIQCYQKTFSQPELPT